MQLLVQLQGVAAGKQPLGAGLRLGGHKYKGPNG